MKYVRLVWMNDSMYNIVYVCLMEFVQFVYLVYSCHSYSVELKNHMKNYENERNSTIRGHSQNKIKSMQND